MLYISSVPIFVFFLISEAETLFHQFEGEILPLSQASLSVNSERI